jgi:hypothetical protein
MEMVKLTQPAQMRAVWQKLHDVGVVLVSFASQATHSPLLIVDPWRTTHFGYEEGFGYGGKMGSYHYVGLMEFGGLYPLTLGCLHRGYVHEKLRLRTAADAANITVFLNAMGQESLEALDEYLQSLVLDSDHIDHHYYNEHPGAL